MSTGSDWDALLSTAMVGTGRRGLPDDVLAGVVDPGAVEADGPEAAVLASAAVLGAYRRAGWVPPAWRGAIAAPAEQDPRPEASDTATQVLELLLDRNVRIDGGNELLAKQWLVACAAAGRRPPARLLVILLQLATANPHLRDTVRTAAGPRGAWLAARNRRWAWAAPPDAGDVDERFATATRTERLALLTAVRRTHPDRGRRLVEATWAGEQAATRAGLLDALATGLSDADEPFLESTLDDRAVTVRAAAAALLDRLPGSRRAARMAARIPSPGELPDEPDAAGRRDGIVDQRELRHGLRASWLIQIVGAAPLPPTTSIDRATPELVTGWTKAALRQRNQEWLRALARANPTPELLAALTPGEATRIVAGQDTVDARFAGLLAACPGPWPADFSTTIATTLRHAKLDGVLTLVFQSLAENLHPAALPAVEDWLTGIPEDNRARRRTLRGLAHALTIRRTIQQEFT
ncbi:MAG: hypothetical protein GEV28_22985 [Actinophytocola sp.]|uniref:DUF5691 domain-containing protein n=1 Tax=Actinophytocola sp. TaxID=1872138 RepID=UPI0013231B09|nr:DUF5691 domain-containing protein [Actinophytocola sp.]MPZ83099.1 hypothetical protein [Actinophytocola sp.]